MTALNDRHDVARARELAYAGGIPLRDRWGYAAADQDVLTLLKLLREHPDDFEAAQAVGIANALGDVELCSGPDSPLEELEELQLVTALRPLAGP